MAITNYDELRKATSRWLATEDFDIDFDTFLQMCEVEIYSNPDEPLKLLSLDTIATATTATDSRFLALPNAINLNRKLTITIDGYQRGIQYTSPSNIVTQESIKGIPEFYTISNNQIEFDRIPDGAYEVTINYQMQDDALTTTNQTNAILTRYPNIYLYGCVLQGWILLQDDQQEAKYGAYFLNAIKDANRREREIKYPTGMSVKAARVV